MGSAQQSVTRKSKHRAIKRAVEAQTDEKYNRPYNLHGEQVWVGATRQVEFVRAAQRKSPSGRVESRKA